MSVLYLHPIFRVPDWRRVEFQLLNRLWADVFIWVPLRIAYMSTRQHEFAADQCSRTEGFIFLARSVENTSSDHSDGFVGVLVGCGLDSLKAAAYVHFVPGSRKYVDFLTALFWHLLGNIFVLHLVVFLRRLHRVLLEKVPAPFFPLVLHE